MTSIKRFGLAALCVVAMALVAGTSATAIAADVIPMRPTGAEPNASGVVQTRIRGNWHQISEAKVACQGLTPGATYSASAWWYDYRYGYVSANLGGFVANNSGNGQSHWERFYPTGEVFFLISRDDGTGSQVVVLIAP